MSSEIKNKKLNLVKLSVSALKIVSQSDIKNDIITILKVISNLPELKKSKFSTIVKYVCELVENTDYKASDPTLKIDKKQLAISIMVTVFAELNNENDINRLGELIDFICDHGLIKAVAQSTVVANTASSWIKKSCCKHC